MFYQFYMAYGNGAKLSDCHVFNCRADTEAAALKQVSYYIERGWKIYECRLFISMADMLGDEAEKERSLKRKRQRLDKIKRDIAERHGFAELELEGETDE